MPNLSAIVIKGIIALLALGFMYVVWPTPYKYTFMKRDRGIQIPIRISRITGEAEMLINVRKGWEGKDKPKKQLEVESTGFPKLDISGFEVIPTK